MAEVEGEVSEWKTALADLATFVRSGLQQVQTETNASIAKVHDQTSTNIAKLQATADRVLRSVQAVEEWQPEMTSGLAELATGCVNTTGSSDRAVPAKCSTFGLVPDASVVPAIEVPLVVEVVTPTSPILANAWAFPFVRQLSVLKPDKRMPTTCSTEVLEHEVDATQLYIKGVLASAASSPQVHAELLIADTGNRIQVGNVMPFDPGTKLQSSFQALVAIPLARVEVCVLPSGGENHDKLNLDTMCNISPTADNQWFRKTSSCGILINCQQYNRLLVDALGRIVTWEVDGNWLYKGRSIINIIDINLTMPWDPGEQLIPCEMPWPFPCIYSQVNNSKWTGQQLTNEDIMAASVPSSMHCCDSLDVSSFYNHKHDHARLDGLCTKSDSREQDCSCIHYKLQAVTGLSYILVARLGEMDHIGDLAIWSLMVPCDAGTMQPTEGECEATWF